MQKYFYQTLKLVTPAAALMFGFSAPVYASLGPCYFDASSLKVTGMSIETAQAIHDNPGVYANFPWCDPLQGVYLGDLDVNKNGIIDALEPPATPTPSPAPVSTVAPTPAPKAVAAPTATAKAVASPRATDNAQVLGASDEQAATPVVQGSTPTPAPTATPAAATLKLSAKSKPSPVWLWAGIAAVVLLGWYMVVRFMKKPVA